MHVIDSLGGSGGAEHGLVREISRFDHSHQQRVVTLYQKDALADQLESHEISHVSLGFDASSAGWSWPWLSVALRNQMRSFGPDVVQTSLFMGNLVGQLAARSLSIPVLSTLTLSGDERLLRSFQPGADSWKATVLRRTAALASDSPKVWFRALTQDAANTNLDQLGLSRSRAVVIPRGVPPTLEPEQVRSRDELGLPNEIPLIVNVGRQTAQKGHRYLIDAFVRVLEQSRAHLVIIGREGDATKSLIKLIHEKGVEDQVTLTGYTPFAQHYLAHASVFAFPSLMEGLGTAVLEAMSHGIPVIAFDIPPVREISEDGSLCSLIDVGDTTSFSNALERALNGEMSELAEHARSNVMAHYSIDAIATQVEKRLEEVARSKAV